MESPAEVYRELCLLRLKYENLCGVCRKLLKTWPNHDPSGRATKLTAAEPSGGAASRLKTGNVEQNSVQATNQDEDVAKEAMALTKSTDLKLLEEILSKAQRVRASLSAEDDGATAEHKSARSKPRRGAGVVGASLTTAAGVYGRAQTRRTPTVQTRSKPVPATSRSAGMSRGRPGASQTAKGAPKEQTHMLVKTRSVTVAKTAASGKRVKSVSSTGTWKDPSERQEVTGEDPRLSPLGAGGQEMSLEGGVDGSISKTSASQVVSHNMEEEEMEPAGFDIRRDGFHLSMPSKYHRLHGALSKIGEHFQSVTPNSEGRAAANHFCSRLTAKEPASSAQTVQLLLAREEYGLLKDQLLFLTPQELAVSERTKWQDVLRIKTKMESINHAVQTLQKQLSTTETSLRHSDKEQGSPLQETLTALSPPPCGYTTLREWQAMSLSELQLKLLVCEAEILRFCEEVVIPRICQLQGTHGNSSYLPALIQAVYDLAGLDCKPVYLATEQ